MAGPHPCAVSEDEGRYNGSGYGAGYGSDAADAWDAPRPSAAAGNGASYSSVPTAGNDGGAFGGFDDDGERYHLF